MFSEVLKNLICFVKQTERDKRLRRKYKSEEKEIQLTKLWRNEKIEVSEQSPFWRESHSSNVAFTLRWVEMAQNIRPSWQKQWWMNQLKSIFNRILGLVSIFGSSDWPKHKTRQHDMEPFLSSLTMWNIRQCNLEATVKESQIFKSYFKNVKVNINSILFLFW